MSKHTHNQTLSLPELDNLEIGAEVLDWESDVMVKEETDAWYYRDQPMRGNVKRPFSSLVIHRAYGPIRFLSEGRRS